MGGFGSGQKRKKKATVETSLRLDIMRLSARGEFNPHIVSVGKVTWTNSQGERIFGIRFWSEPKAKNGALLHITTRMESDGTEAPLVEPILLMSTIPNFGGVRWWFICPLNVDGVACRRRVRLLYLPHGARYFGCRTCYNLTYESAQSHDARVGKLMKNPQALVRAFNSENPIETLRACQAYFKLRDLL